MPKDNLKKTRVLVPAITTAVLVLMAAPMLLPGALAAPRLHAQECDIVDATLVCDFDVSGLGSATSADAILTGEAEITTGCVNRGGNEPRGLERETVDVVAQTTVNVEGGRADIHLEEEFDAADRECPSANMEPIIVCVSITDLTLQVIPNAGPDRTFNIPDESTC